MGDWDTVRKSVRHEDKFILRADSAMRECGLVAIYNVYRPLKVGAPAGRCIGLNSVTKLKVVQSNTFAMSLDEAESRRKTFTAGAELIARVPLRRLEFERRWDALPIVADAIEKDLVDMVRTRSPGNSDSGSRLGSPNSLANPTPA